MSRRTCFCFSLRSSCLSPLPKSIVLSYRPAPSDTLHKISPQYALLIMSRRKARPESDGFGPLYFQQASTSYPLYLNNLQNCKSVPSQKFAKPPESVVLWLSYLCNEERKISMALRLFIYDLCPLSLSLVPRDWAADPHSCKIKIA